jgi:hypothetical protein
VSGRSATVAAADALTLPVRVDDPDELARLAAWRARGVDDETAACCLLAGRLDRMIDDRRARHRHVVVACLPKCASTYLDALLVHATGFRRYLLNTTGHDTERNIDARSIPMFLAGDTVSQEHMRATRENVRLLARLGVRPVVLVRDLLDLLVSMRDHAAREPGRGPAGHVPADFARWPPADRLELIVRFATPWLLTMVTSWLDAARELPTLWLRYDDVVGRPAETVGRVLDHVGVAVPRARIDEAVGRVDPATTRFNRGVSGRGRAELTEGQRSAVRAAAAAYRGTYDLSIVGL